MTEKFNQHILFPEILNVSTYNSTISYDLNALIEHEGEHFNCGHYFSYIKSANWYKVDDTQDKVIFFVKFCKIIYFNFF